MAGLPRITFNVQTDGLQRAGDPVQKIPGLIITGATVAGKIAIGESHQIFTLAAAEALGIEATGDNAFAHKHIAEFYEESGQGAELWIMLVSDATTYTEIGDVNENIAKKLIADADGAIRILGVIKEYDPTDTITDGIDADCHTAVEKFEALRAFYFDKYRPFRTILSGNAFTGTVADLKDYGIENYTSVMMFLGSLTSSKEASVGALLGRFTRISTQRSPAVPRDGALTTGVAYLTSTQPLSDYEDTLDAIHDKKYTVLRTFTGRSGAYVSDDQTLSTAANNDYSSMARGLVIDQAILIAYDSLLDNLNEDVEISTSGQIHPAVVKAWQSAVETQIILGMKDAGIIQDVQAYIDPAQNILSTDTLVVKLSILPKGYAKFIDVNIGFTTSIDN